MPFFMHVKLVTCIHVPHEFCSGCKETYILSLELWHMRLNTCSAVLRSHQDQIDDGCLSYAWYY
jgi:hypothetical protein